MMVIGRCLMEWCGVVEASSIDVGMSIKKELDALMMVKLSCIMK